MNRFALRLKLHKVEGGVVYHNALLQKTIPNSKLISGYALCLGTACWHTWVRDDKGKDYDVASHLAVFQYSETLPEGVQEIQHESIDQNKQLYELYTKDPKSFWAQAPVSVKKFRVIE